MRDFDIVDGVLKRYTGEDTVVVIPTPAVHTIGKYAFLENKRVEQIIVPFGVTEIEPSAFSGCFARRIYIADSVKSIGARAFKDCLYLSSVKLPEGLSVVEEESFHSCGIEEIHIPDSVREIKDSAFVCCLKLSRVHIPRGLERIGATVFMNCSGIHSFFVPSTLCSIGSFAFMTAFGTVHIYSDAPAKRACWGSAFEGVYIFAPSSYVFTWGCAGYSADSVKVERFEEYEQELQISSTAKAKATEPEVKAATVKVDGAATSVATTDPEQSETAVSTDKAPTATKPKAAAEAAKAPLPPKRDNAIVSDADAASFCAKLPKVERALVFVDLARELTDSGSVPTKEQINAFLALDDEERGYAGAQACAVFNGVSKGDDSAALKALGRFFKKLKRFYYTSIKMCLFNRVQFDKQRYDFSASGYTAHDRIYGGWGRCDEDIADTLEIFSIIEEAKAYTDEACILDFDKKRWISYRSNLEYTIDYVLTYAPKFCKELDWLYRFFFQHFIYDSLPKNGKRVDGALPFSKLREIESKAKEYATRYPHLDTKNDSIHNKFSEVL